MPKYEGMAIKIDEVLVTPNQVEDELMQVRTRFGTLVTVDRPAAKGDFVTLDLNAKIGGKVVDSAGSISYEVGSGDLIEGLDEAVETLTAGESTIFKSKLVGGDHAGERAQVTVTATTVKERQLPEADDDFAQLASEFDTIDELKDDLRTRLARVKLLEQGYAAREKVAEDLAAYKLRVTTEHPNYERMNEMMQALTRSMDELKHDVRAIFERINNGTRVPH